MKFEIKTNYFNKEAYSYECCYCDPKKNKKMKWFKQDVYYLHGFEIMVEDFYSCEEHGIFLQQKRFNYSPEEIQKIKEDFE